MSQDVTFRRIRGRIVAIKNNRDNQKRIASGSVGAALVYSARNDVKMKVGKSTVRSSQFGPIRFYSASTNKGLKAFAINTNSGKKSSKIQYVMSFDKGKGYGKELLKGLSSNESRLGKKYLRGVLVSTDTIKFSKKQKTKFVKQFYTRTKSRLVGLSKAKDAINIGRKYYNIVSITKIPKIRKIAKSVNMKSPALILGSALLAYSAFRKDSK